MTRSQRFTLVAAILGSGVAAIDGTIVNVVLPAIQADLGGGFQGQQWISNAYLLTLGSLKEGVDGSSPSEACIKSLQMGILCCL